MAVRHYLCDVVGTGTDADPYRARPRRNPAARRTSAVIPCGPDGRPLHDWCLVAVDADDHGAIAADVLADVTTPPSGGVRNNLKRQRNIELSAADDYRTIGPRLNPNYVPPE